MKRSHKKAVKIVLVVTSVGFIVWIYYAGRVEAPLFTAKDIYGGTFSLKEFKGRVILIYFWRIRCIPSMKSVDRIRMLSKRFEGLIVVGVCIDRNVSMVRNYVKLRNISWRIIIDNGTISELYGVTGTPEFILIDKDGYIAYRLKGLRDDFDHLMSKKISKLNP